MGETNCKHTNTEKTLLNKIPDNFLRDYEIYEYKCIDCPSKWRIEVPVGKLTGITYGSNKIDKSTCPHKQFTVDTQNMKTMSEVDSLKFVFVFFTGHFFDGAQYIKYYIAKSTCDRCGFEFLVKSYPTFIWENQIQKETLGEWKPVMIQVEKPKQYKEEYAPVKSIFN